MIVLPTVAGTPLFGDIFFFSGGHAIHFHDFLDCWRECQHVPSTVLTLSETNHWRLATIDVETVDQLEVSSCFHSPIDSIAVAIFVRRTCFMSGWNMME